MVRLRRDWKDQEFYSTIQLSKTELARALGVAKSTLLIWERTCFYAIESFRNSYLKKSDGSWDLTAPYNPYQCWVLATFGRIVSVSKTIERAKVYVKPNQHVFSISVFKKNLKELETSNAN